MIKNIIKEIIKEVIGLSVFYFFNIMYLIINLYEWLLWMIRINDLVIKFLKVNSYFSWAHKPWHQDTTGCVMNQ
jgi:hypothetical protein